MSTNDVIAVPYTNLSASALINSGPTRLVSIFCASSSSGTLKIWDNTSAATTILINTFSLTGATNYQINALAKTGVFFTIGGTADITAFWLQG